ncbi:helix-turn-helix domain-containing protein [Rhodanobacter sp. A1T4]|uniref:helix-turn-helix domain-containing protein n=1 Tax=Rhodanobacter sp. A1T4 TaxID=2723087 RepID=UPI00160B80BE|nr:helix-turn-helix domain-containing protein [Rhodanobacter sp. A1T4]MBB6246368.1 hypothetical protein [Rhodanobacter sp. A1T4]
MNLPPQSKTVLAHLRAEAHITSWQAEGVYRIRRLASRIDEIVAAGYEVIKTEARDATGQRYIRYSLSATQKRYAGPIHPPRAKCLRLTVEHIEETMHELGYCRCAVEKLINRLKESA